MQMRPNSDSDDIKGASSGKTKTHDALRIVIFYIDLYSESGVQPY